jgi:hypothetical protein
MATKKAVEFLTGKIYWAKILGAPRPNYNDDAREWAFEFEPNEEGLQVIIKHGLADRIKGKGYAIGTKAQHKDREPFLVLKKSEFNKEGEPNKPIRVYDADDTQWDEETLIGNGSSADVKIDIRDYGPGKKSGIYPVAVRIKELVPYVSNEFGGMDGGDAPKGKAPAKKKDDFKKDFGLEDDDPLDDPLP